MQLPIDLRSDTVTKPTPEMRLVMAKAEVGDDVYAEDPTVNLLQERVAAMFGKQAALFVPSGTMSNQIAIRVHTQPGDELLCDSTSHIFTWEGGAPAALSGVTTHIVPADYGVLDVSQLRSRLRPKNEHYSQSRLVCLENTHNRGGGRVYPLAKIQAISQWAREHQLTMHLDGARIWNAHVASGIALADWAAPFDTVSVCFSKGLGAPIGSALLGPSEFIAKARRVRKLFGGAMRQAGILAAAALHALDHHVARLADDHQHAKIIAQAVIDTPGLELDPPFVETNLVWFKVDPERYSINELSAKLKEHGIWMSILDSNMMRACTHLDVSQAQATYVAEKLREICQELPKPTNETAAAFD